MPEKLKSNASTSCASRQIEAGGSRSPHSHPGGNGGKFFRSSHLFIAAT